MAGQNRSEIRPGIAARLKLSVSSVKAYLRVFDAEHPIKDRPGLSLAQHYLVPRNHK